MEFTITIQNNDELSLVQESELGYRMIPNKNSADFLTETVSGTITSQKTQEQEFTIWTSNYFFEEEVLLNIESTTPVLFFHLILRNSIKINFGEKEYLLSEGQFNLSSFPQFKVQAKVPKGKPFQTFHIHFEPYFLNNFLNGSKEFENFIREIHSGFVCRLSEDRHFVSAEMMSAVESILKNPYRGRTGRLFIASQVNVLLLQGLLKIRGDKNAQSHLFISKENQEKIILARDYLMEHLDQRITTQKLSRIAGLNEQILKKGFKQLFGNTISRFHENLRLQEAMRLLIKTDMGIAEIGYSLGFEYPNYFSTVFKKKFGLSPGFLKKQRGRKE